MAIKNFAPIAAPSFVAPNHLISICRPSDITRCTSGPSSEQKHRSEGKKDIAINNSAQNHYRANYLFENNVWRNILSQCHLRVALCDFSRKDILHCFKNQRLSAYQEFFKYIPLINREWGHYRETSDRGLDVLTRVIARTIHQGRDLRFACNDQTDEVNKLFIIGRF